MRPPPTCVKNPSNQSTSSITNMVHNIALLPMRICFRVQYEELRGRRLCGNTQIGLVYNQRSGIRLFNTNPGLES